VRRGEAWKPLRENGGWMRTPERAVFLALLERSNNDDCSIPPKMTPGLAGLAEMACCSKSTVALALKHLERHNWLTRKQSKGGAGCKTTYQLRAGLRCYPDCEQRHPRTVRQPDSFQSGESDSRIVKLSDSHPQTHRSTPFPTEGKRREGERGRERV
jgi:hypothetical protein